MHVSAQVLLSLLGDWARAADSLYQGLADAVRALIERGDLPPGTVLPSERTLASSLNVSRGTVMNAIELLREARLVESQRGSRTRVRLNAIRPLLPDLSAVGDAVASRSLSGRLFDNQPDVIDLALAVVRDVNAIRDVPLPTEWDAIADSSGGHGYHPQGLVSLRQSVCDYYRDRGLKTEPEQILITAGAQQGLDLCATLALRPGDCVVVESPTYPGAVDTFARHGVRLVSIPFTSHWDRPQALVEAIQRNAPRLVYLMPGMHNPGGRPLPDRRRRDVARLSDQYPLYVIEDNTLADTAFQPGDQPLTAASAESGRVLSLGSLSKSAWGGLRIGWIRADEGLVSRMARSKAAKDFSLSPLPQLIASSVLADFDKIIARQRDHLMARAALIQAELARVLSSWTFSAPEGGLSLWVRLPHGRADAFTHVALRHGVAVIAGGAHCMDGAGNDRLRISFAQPEEILTEGVRRLRSAWDEYSSRLKHVAISAWCGS